jgi:hypothetical protein
MSIFLLTGHVALGYMELVSAGRAFWQEASVMGTMGRNARTLRKGGDARTPRKGRNTRGGGNARNAGTLKYGSDAKTGAEQE